MAKKGVNKVIIIGNLGNDPELKYTSSGKEFCSMRIATSESYTDREGAMQERTEWHRVVAWGKLAEICDKYLSKGRQVYVEGSLATRSWEYNGEQRYMTEINAREVQFLGGKSDNSTSDRQGNNATPDEDIPF